MASRSNFYGEKNVFVHSIEKNGTGVEVNKTLSSVQNKLLLLTQ